MDVYSIDIWYWNALYNTDFFYASVRKLNGKFSKK